MQSLVSVVIPVHNLEVWVEECIESVLAQDVDLEVIVVDDHSTDSSFELVSAIAKRDPRVKLVRAVSRGGGSARNQGVELATGKYLAFADGDDIVPVGAYRALVESLEGSTAEMVVAPFLKFEANRTINPTYSWGLFDRAKQVTFATAPELLNSRAIWNKLFRRDFWVTNNLQFADVSRSNDIVPMLQAYLAASKINLISKISYLYRVRPGASSMTSRAAGLAGLFSYLEQEAKCLELLRGSSAEPEFWRLFFNSDGWVHLSKALTSPVTASEAEKLSALLQPFELPSGMRLNALKTDAFALARAGFANLAALRIIENAKPAQLLEFATLELATEAKLPELRQSIVDVVLRKLEAAGAGGEATDLVVKVARVAEPNRALDVAKLRQRLDAISEFAGDARPRLLRLQANYGSLVLQLNELPAWLQPQLKFVHRATKLTTAAKSVAGAYRVSQLAFALPGYWDARVEFKVAGANYEAELAVDSEAVISEHELSGVKVTRSAKGRSLPTLTLSSSRLWFALKKLVKRLLA